MLIAEIDDQCVRAHLIVPIAVIVSAPLVFVFGDSRAKDVQAVAAVCTWIAELLEPGLDRVFELLMERLKGFLVVVAVLYLGVVVVGIADPEA